MCGKVKKTHNLKAESAEKLRTASFKLRKPEGEILDDLLEGFKY